MILLELIVLSPGDLVLETSSLGEFRADEVSGLPLHLCVEDESAATAWERDELDIVACAVSLLVDCIKALGVELRQQLVGGLLRRVWFGCEVAGIEACGEVRDQRRLLCETQWD